MFEAGFLHSVVTNIKFKNELEGLNVAFSMGTQLSCVLPNMKRVSEDKKENNASH